MKKFCLVAFAMFVNILCFGQSGGGANDFERVSLEGISIEIPKDCELNEELSQPDQGAFCCMTPDKSFVFFFMYLETGDDFSVTKRLNGEAQQLGWDLEECLFYPVNISDDDEDTMPFWVAAFEGGGSAATGVYHLDPDDHTGLYIYVQSAHDAFEQVFPCILSVKKE